MLAGQRTTRERGINMRMRFERVADVTEIKGIEKDAIKKIPMARKI